MKTIPANLFAIMATSLSGDVGGYTTWTTKRGTIVWSDHAPPTKPPTLRQLAQRARVSAAGYDWRQLNQAVRTSWATLVSGAHTCLSPFAAYMAASLNAHSHDVLRTCARQAGLPGLPAFTPR